MLFAGGLKFVLMSCLIYAPGTFLFLPGAAGAGQADLHRDRTGSSSASSLVGAVIGIIGLVTGLITI